MRTIQLVEWIPISEQLPDHDQPCIVGNVHGHRNPNIALNWKAATFIDSKAAEALMNQSLPESVFKITLPDSAHRKGFRLHGEVKVRPTYEFTHWWPIPKPFTK